MDRRIYIGIIILTVVAAFSYSNAHGQNYWEKTFGGSDNDSGYSVQQTPDGGYILAGSTRSFGAGDSDAYLVKTDGNGNKVWSKTFGGGYNDSGTQVQQTADGGFIIAGEIELFGALNEDVYLIKTDGDGNELWSKNYGGSGRDFGFSVQQTTDGGFIIAGKTTSFGADENGDVYLIKTDADGNEIWSKTFGGSNIDSGHSVQQTTDGGYIITGHTFPYDYSDVYLIKTDGNGNEIWSKTFGGSYFDFGYSVQQTTDGGFIVTGETYSFGSGECDVYLIKTDGNGNEIWSKTFGGSDNDSGYSVQQTPDGGYILAGKTTSFGAGDSDAYLVKTDGNGNKVWSKTFGGSDRDGISSVQKNTDGGFILAGSTESFGAGHYDVYLIYYKPYLFADVPPGYWAEEAIYKIYNAGITQGCSQNPLRYCPNVVTNRSQVAVFLGRGVHGSEYDPPAATGIFADVPVCYWAADWIEQFYDDGLTKGCKIDPHDVQAPVIYYCPEYPVTRTTMAIFLLRAKHGANYEPPPAIGIFEDVWVNYWAADWIEQLYKEGITVGCKQNPLMYCPSKHVTRAQMAVFLARMLGL